MCTPDSVLFVVFYIFLHFSSNFQIFLVTGAKKKSFFWFIFIFSYITCQKLNLYWEFTSLNAAPGEFTGYWNEQNRYFSKFDKKYFLCFSTFFGYFLWSHYHRVLCIPMAPISQCSVYSHREIFDRILHM